MKKMYLFILCLILIISSTGCGCVSKYIENKKIEKQLSNQASENATNYIKEKYNIIPTIESTKVEKKDSNPIPNLISDPTGYVFVKLSYNDKIFDVYISGEESNTDGLDNYQYDEITSDLLALIKEKINIEPYKYIVYYDEKEYFDYKEYPGLIKNLYNKEDLYKFIENKDIKILLEYINESNLEYIKINNLLKDFKNKKLVLINYNSIDSYNTSSTHEYNLYGYGTEEKYFLENSLNIESAYTLIEGTDKYYKFDAN